MFFGFCLLNLGFLCLMLLLQVAHFLGVLLVHCVHLLLPVLLGHSILLHDLLVLHRSGVLVDVLYLVVYSWCCLTICVVEVWANVVLKIFLL